jgi:hypothetical protein
VHHRLVMSMGPWLNHGDSFVIGDVTGIFPPASLKVDVKNCVLNEDKREKINAILINLSKTVENRFERDCKSALFV